MLMSAAAVPMRLSMTTPPQPSSRRRRTRWVAVAAVAVVAVAGGAVAARGGRRARIAAPAPPPQLPVPVVPARPAPPVRPPAEPAPAATAATAAATRRYTLIAVAAVAAVAAGGSGVFALQDHLGETASPPALTYPMTGYPDPYRTGNLGSGLYPVITSAPTGYPGVASGSPGFGPGQPTWPTPSPTRTMAPGPVPAGGVVPRNAVVVVHGDSGEEMTLDVTGFDDPLFYSAPDQPDNPALEPAIGRRLVSVTLRVENSGGVPFLDDLEKHAWVLDTAGHAYPPDTAMTRIRNHRPPARLDARTLTARTMIFNLKGNVELNRFRFSLHPGRSRQTQVWRLP
jgi:hypothetical protein